MLTCTVKTIGQQMDVTSGVTVNTMTLEFSGGLEVVVPLEPDQINLVIQQMVATKTGRPVQPVGKPVPPLSTTDQETAPPDMGDWSQAEDGMVFGGKSPSNGGGLVPSVDAIIRSIPTEDTTPDKGEIATSNEVDEDGVLGL